MIFQIKRYNNYKKPSIKGSYYLFWSVYFLPTYFLWHKIIHVLHFTHKNKSIQSLKKVLRNRICKISLWTIKSNYAAHFVNFFNIHKYLRGNSIPKVFKSSTWMKTLSMFWVTYFILVKKNISDYFPSRKFVSVTLKFYFSGLKKRADMSIKKSWIRMVY